jgi:hypothetical protein
MKFTEPYLLKEVSQKLNGGKGLDHFSYTQLSKWKTIAMWIVDYGVRDQNRRRKDKKKFHLGFGSCSSNVAQRLIGKYIFRGATKEEIKDRDYHKNFDYEYSQYIKNPFDAEDKQKRELLKETLHATIKNILKAVKNIFGNDDIMCERYVALAINNLFLEIIGRVDFESNDKFAECKVKPPQIKKYKNDFKIYSKKLPEGDPEPDNVKQTAFYWKSSSKKPFLFYANEKDFIIYDDSHPALWDDHLNYCYEEMVQKAMTIQRLLVASNGDLKVMAGLVEKPDLNNWMMNDASADQLAVIKELWG